MSSKVPAISSDVRNTARFARNECLAESNPTRSFSMALPGSGALSGRDVTPPLGRLSGEAIWRPKPAVPRLARLWAEALILAVAEVIPDRAMAETDCIGNREYPGKAVVLVDPRHVGSKLEFVTPRSAQSFTLQSCEQLGRRRALTPNPSLMLTRYGRHCKPGLSHSHYRLSPGLQYLPTWAA